MNKVTIGQRNQLITIKKPVETQDSYGEEDIQWQKVSDAWAKVSLKTGDQSEDSGREHTSETYFLIIGWLPDIDDTMQIIWGDKTLTISTSIDPDGTSQVLKITAFKE